MGQVPLQFNVSTCSTRTDLRDLVWEESPQRIQQFFGHGEPPRVGRNFILHHWGISSIACCFCLCLFLPEALICDDPSECVEMFNYLQNWFWWCYIRLSHFQVQYCLPLFEVIITTSMFNVCSNASIICVLFSMAQHGWYFSEVSLVMGF